MTKRIFNHYMNKKDKILHAQGSDIEYLICLLYVYEIRLFKCNDAFSLNCKYCLHLHKNLSNLQFLKQVYLIIAAMAQWVRALAPQAEGWVFESKPRQT